MRDPLVARDPGGAATTPSQDDAFLNDFLARSTEAMAAFTADRETRRRLVDMAAIVSTSLRAGGKLLIAGNGGSAADAQHIAGEFTSRLMYDRAPLAAVALTTDTSSLTAIANDYDFEQVFSRQVAALGRRGDVFLGISTSGRSPNVLRALEAARREGLRTLGFAGIAAPEMEGCEVLLAAPSDWTPIIQQVHITAAHVLCALVERTLCPR